MLKSNFLASVYDHPVSDESAMVKLISTFKAINKAITTLTFTENFCNLDRSVNIMLGRNNRL